ncbi:MAG: hypothetical protein PVH87_07500 [Desulfobacteraceae bacterium]|jgi:hypothetical protein
MKYSLDELKAMIPVYLNGSLPEPEAKALEEALRRHPELESELMEFAEIQESYAGIEDKLPIDSDAVFSRVRDGIRSESRQASETLSDGPAARLLRFVKQIYHTPALSWSMAGLQFAALLALFFLVPQQAFFTTYSSPSSTETDKVHLNVVFIEEAREIEIRTLLRKLDAAIVSGPSDAGLYVLAVDKTADIDALLRQLDASPIVRLAKKTLGLLERQHPPQQAPGDRLKNSKVRAVLLYTG